MVMRVATWNMAYSGYKNNPYREFHQEAWKYMLDSFQQSGSTGDCIKNNIDIFLFQEALPPDELKMDKQHFAGGGIKSNKWYKLGDVQESEWGSGIYSKKYPIQQIVIPTDYESALVIAEVNISDKEKFIIISLYGLFEYILEAGRKKEVYSITTLHRMLSDLTGILNGHVGRKPRTALCVNIDETVYP